jgi:DNA polymerase-3 subunit gamma/tau
MDVEVYLNRIPEAEVFDRSYINGIIEESGKTTSAKVLARAVNCLNPKDGEPCNECEICKAALDGSLTDIVELDAASNNGVDNIRSIIEEVNFLPVSAKYRVYIIDEVHMLSTGAFNALLKTLEEPPAHVKFILCTTDPQKVPATIISRCLRFDFKRISDDFICQNLAQICTASKIKYTDDSLKLIAELSEGAMRDALTILERCAQDGENNIDVEKIKALTGIPEMSYIIDIVTNIANKDTDSLIKLLDDIIKEGKNTSNILWEVIKFLKDVLVFKATNTTSSRYSDKEKEQSNFIDITSLEELLEIF